MSRHTTDPGDPGREPGRRPRPAGHEREVDREINLSGVGKTVFGILVLTLVSMAAMWVMFEVLLASEERRDPPPPALEEARRPALPPGPRLQASPEAELESYRAHENALLSSYGWQDREAGTVRIPIGRAMELIVAEGRGAMATDPAAGAATEEAAPPDGAAAAAAGLPAAGEEGDGAAAAAEGNGP